MYDGHALLKPTHTPVRVHDSEDSLVQAEISRTKMSERPGTIQPINYAELNALYSHFVPQKELSQRTVDDETELTQLKDAITSVRIQNDGFKVENENVKRRYQELSETNTHSRDALTGKITALTAENAKLKTELISKISSGSIACEKPKVLASGMCRISTKGQKNEAKLDKTEHESGKSEKVKVKANQEKLNQKIQLEGLKVQNPKVVFSNENYKD
ncbi:hypothetical protein Tco_0212831 [Tanacetum coccineum]